MGGNSSRALNAVTTAITAALGGQTDLQTVSNALAPYAAQVIGEKFGHGEDKNTTAQMVSHAILGATLAYVNGGNPAAGGTAAVASEAAANYFANQYKDDPRYQNEKGEFIPNLLPEDVKTQIRDLTAAIGAVAGGTIGDSAFNAQLAGVVGQNAVENNALENVLMPHEIDEIKNDTTGQYSKEQLQAIKDNSTYKINEDGDFIVCIKVAGSSCAPRAGERYATEKEILEKGGETVATTAASWGATKLLEPIIVVASKSGVWTKVTGTVKGWFGKNNDIGESTRSIENIENDILDTKRVGFGEKGSGSGNKVDQISKEPVLDKDGNKIPVHIKADGSAMGNKFAEQEFPSVPRAHGFNDIIDNYAGQAKKTTLSNGASLYQIEGSMNGTVGRFEWIVDPKLGGVSHRMFIPNGKITGVPTKP